MAKQSSRSKSGGSNSNSRQKRDEYPDYSVVDPSKIPDGPDVLVDVPVVKVDKIESKYYADGEDAYSMRMDLSDLRLEAEEERKEDEDEDEGDEVGSAGKKSDGQAGAKKAKDSKKKRVKVGRGVGVVDLVEKNESSK